jgi:hypothetical protein
MTLNGMAKAMPLQDRKWTLAKAMPLQDRKWTAWLKPHPFKTGNETAHGFALPRTYLSAAA